MEQRCGTCKFQGTDMVGQAVCRRNPPVVEAGWPTVDPERDWCGEYKRKPSGGESGMVPVRGA